MSQKRSYKQYPKEFKEEAVALVREQGYSVAEAAKSLGIATNMLYKSPCVRIVVASNFY
ncbi:MAG: transposase [Cellvibrionaceae bacterium]|nr:transposase [Cellvibrionaceae bacterium]